jgi:vacuolar protein sorting-associated protein 54
MDLVDLGETHSKKTFYTARSQLLSQAKAFLQKNHDSGISRLQSSLDSETWDEVFIAKKYQKLVDKGFITLMFGSNSSILSPQASISTYDSLSPPALSALQKLNALRSFWWDSSDLEGDTKPNSKEEKTADSEDSSFLIVDDEKFKVTASMLTLFDVVTFYVECCLLLDYIAPEALIRLSQVLSIYNTRSRQLILGTMNMQASGVKSVSAKVITMSSQCLGVLVSSIPLLLTALQEKLPAKHHRSLKDFDRVLKDLRDHREELFVKLRPPPPPPPPPKK